MTTHERVSPNIKCLTGIIRKFTFIVDEKKLGMEVLAFAFVNLSPDSLRKHQVISVGVAERGQFDHARNLKNITLELDILLS